VDGKGSLCLETLKSPVSGFLQVVGNKRYFNPHLAKNQKKIEHPYQTGILRGVGGHKSMIRTRFPTVRSFMRPKSAHSPE
jgi:hypothetical protein